MLGVARSDDGEIFSGVRFVLIGFDCVSEAQYRLELVRRGGVDVCGYSSSCTHVIVSGRVYDDPVCVAARNDGKIVVTELWIEDSADFMILADANRILYRPVRDLNGIPGSESLFICLTGYQRRERDDIVKMVDLMGAHFSKPLIATKVTHLICYKFEGDKYELARRVNIKLVNHLWLEDCLKAWEILPVDNYKRSGWELEIMEPEATCKKNADGNSREQQLTKGSMTEEKCWQNSGLSSSMVMFSSPKTAVQTVEALITMQLDTMPLSVPSTKLEDVHVDNASLPICMESNKTTVSNIFGNCNIPVKFVTQDGKGSNDTLMKEASLCSPPVTSSNRVCPNKEDNKLSLAAVSGGLMNSDAVEVKSNSLIYSRKNQRRSVSTDDLSRKVGVFSRSLLENDIPSLTIKQDANEIKFVGIQSSTTNTDVPLVERLHNELSQKRKIPNYSSISPKLQPSNSDMPVLQNSSANFLPAQHEFPLVNDTCQPGPDHEFNDVRSLSDVMVPTPSEPNEGKKLSHRTANGSSIIYDTKEVKSSSIIYSRKMPRRSTSAEVSRKIGVFPRGSPIPRLTLKDDINDIASAGVQNPTTNIVLHQMEGACSELPQTRNVYDFSMPQNSQSGDSDMSVTRNSLASSVSVQLNIPLAKVACQGESTSPLDDAKSVPDVTVPAYLPINQKRSSLISSLASFGKSVKHESHSKSNVTTCLKGQLMHSFHSGGEHEDANSPECKVQVAHSKTPERSFQLDNKDVLVVGQWSLQTGGSGQARNLRVAGSPSCSSEDSERGKSLNPADHSSCQASSRRLRKRVVTKKKLSCSSELSVGYSCKGRSSVYSNEVGSPNESTLGTEQEKGAEGEQKDNEENRNMVGIVSKSIIMKDLPIGQNSALTSERIVVYKDSMVSLTGKSVVIESAFKPKEIENPTLEKTAVNKTVREKVKKFRHRQKTQNNHCTDHATKAAIQVWNEAEKENKPAGNVGIIRKTDGLEDQSKVIKCDGASGVNNRRIDDMTNRKLQSHLHEDVISQSAWFIFSGHRVQRTEFQKVVRRLRGRLCRDSHSWSYQATHFIVPNPIRRTEKFFAATASGRWILKTDYLAACNEAGKFLVEEPFEWSGDGLTEDGTISLQAPRKWRLLRERTGHGAFYGMRIIIYGECIAPSLDTLKRVIKAGDGMILATSPPYTRFLKPGVDFAVIGPSMPHTDTWIQEFLRHEIPCVLPDYLVEYVCKHGFPLDKHILYGTHAWAEKSTAKFQSRSKEIVVAEH